MSTLIILGIGTPAPFVVIAVIILFATACASIVRKNERVRPLLKDGWTPLLGAMVISSASGIVLDLFVTRYDGYALLAVAFGGRHLSSKTLRTLTLLTPYFILRDSWRNWLYLCIPSIDRFTCHGISYRQSRGHHHLEEP
jgi:hypothetical protein